mmetsp:Transcript_111804/g.316243  ORF Transcript_111804/g.316243 Transcript_111804/m.316243 type:complete len:1062 (+) Transcript_111804:131-3316(+)
MPTCALFLAALLATVHVVPAIRPRPDIDSLDSLEWPRASLLESEGPESIPGDDGPPTPSGRAGGGAKEDVTDERNPKFSRHYVKGGPYIPSCEQTAILLNVQEACTVDEFQHMAWAVALQLDCQLQKAQNVLDLVTKKYEQAARQIVSEASKEVEGERIRRNITPTFAGMVDCPADSSSVGQKYYDTPDGRQMLMLPQPEGSGTAYAYKGNTVHKLDSPQDIIRMDLEKINHGLWFATVLAQEDFAENARFYYTKGLQQRLRYRGNDPAIVMELAPPTDGHSASAMCLGSPNHNIIDPGNFNAFFNLSNPDRITRYTDDVIRPYWWSTTWSAKSKPSTAEANASGGGSGRSFAPKQTFVALAAKVTKDEQGKPIGTVTLDVNMTALANKFLDKMLITPSVYAAIVDNAGHIIAMSPSARAVLFRPNMSDAELYGDDRERCQRGMTAKELENCTWHHYYAKNLNDAKKDGYSGVDFSEILWLMFRERRHQPNCSRAETEDETATPCGPGNGTRVHGGHGQIYQAPLERTNCSQKIHQASLTFNKVRHDVVYCAFSAVPQWGLIVGTEYQDLEKAATMSIYPNYLDLNKTFYDETELQADHHGDHKCHGHGKGHRTKTHIVTLSNDGRIDFPFVVDMSMISFVKVHPLNGTVKMKERANLTFTLTTCMEEFGVYAGMVRIRSRQEVSRGACFRKAATVHLKMVLSQEKGQFQRFMKFYGKWVLASLVILLVGIAVRIIMSRIKSFYKAEARQQKIVEEALHSAGHLSHPMVLISATAFKRQGKLVSHEEAQRLHQVIWLYTVKQIEEFCSERVIIFISHQWTAFKEPDPTNVQYKAMVMSIETLKVEKHWDEREMFLWVDYTCIPQRHQETQRLAINSLTAYASNVAAFVVVAPPVLHADLCEPCNKETYQRRAWCRAEQLSHLLAAGNSNMYLAEGGVLTPLTKIGGWLEQSTYVFQGDLTCCRRQHAGMERCDKELLVVPMLGLWAQLCQKCDNAGVDDYQLFEVHANLASKLEEVFPSTFTFVESSGSKVNRMLFGQLLTRLPEALEEYDIKRPPKDDGF